jgi:pimeloyl-ACP methyl ester carboxylesterase
MIRRASATAVDLLMCASMNFVQARHRLHSRSRAEMEAYVADGEKLSLQDFHRLPSEGGSPMESRNGLNGETITWPSPVRTPYPKNDTARVDLFPCSRGWEAPTVLMLHALMSASDVGYRKWAARFNELGWNACFLHLPYHYSRVPPGYWNGELAITADLIRNAEGLRQGVIEVRQLMAALRTRGSREFGLLGTSYGGWIGALVAAIEPDLRFVALMAPIVNVHHALWESPAAFTMRRELRRARIEPELVARHFRLGSPLHLDPAVPADRVLLVAGDYDLVARPRDIAALHQKWQGSELLRVSQGHFGYLMMRATVARLKDRFL